MGSGLAIENAGMSMILRSIFRPALAFLSSNTEIVPQRLSATRLATVAFLGLLQAESRW